eukprot:scaffold8244_cov169-Amphora_coffeaeformis.AAC.3
MKGEHSRYSFAAQILSLVLYFVPDLLLRFCYQSVLLDTGSSDNDDNDSKQHAYDNNNYNGDYYAHDDAFVWTDKADERDIMDAQSYDKPVFLVCCCYATFSLWGPCFVFPYLHWKRRTSIYQYYTTEWCGALPFARALCYTCAMAVVLFSANVGYVAGLRYISVALGSALSQGEAPFTVLLAVVTYGRVFGAWEQRGIALGFLGIALVTVPPLIESATGGDRSSYDATTWQVLGCILSTLVGAFGFGAYQIFWPLFDGKRYDQTGSNTSNSIDNEDGDKQQQSGALKKGQEQEKRQHLPPNNAMDAFVDTFATLTLVGVFVLSTSWILLLALHLTGLETFEIPPPHVRGALMLSSVLSALADALNGVACVVATSVVVALAYPLIIPVSVLLEWLIKGVSPQTWGALGWMGTVLLVLGVFCLETNAPDDAILCETELAGLQAECNAGGPVGCFEGFVLEGDDDNIISTADVLSTGEDGYEDVKRYHNMDRVEHRYNNLTNP